MGMTYYGNDAQTIPPLFPWDKHNMGAMYAHPTGSHQELVPWYLGQVPPTTPPILSQERTLLNHLWGQHGDHNLPWQQSQNKDGHPQVPEESCQENSSRWSQERSGESSAVSPGAHLLAQHDHGPESIHWTVHVLPGQHAKSSQGATHTHTSTRLLMLTGGRWLFWSEKAHLPGLRWQILRLGIHLPLHTWYQHFNQAGQTIEETVHWHWVCLSSYHETEAKTWTLTRRRHSSINGK